VILTAAVRVGDGRGTFYTRTGDWLPLVCAAAFAALLLGAAAGPMLRNSR
jgi:hypothetical protein